MVFGARWIVASSARLDSTVSAIRRGDDYSDGAWSCAIRLSSPFSLLRGRTERLKVSGDVGPTVFFKFRGGYLRIIEKMMR